MNAAREEIFKRIKNSLGETAFRVPEKGVIQAIHSELQWNQDGNVVQDMAQRVAEAGGVAQYFTSIEDVQQWLGEFVGEQGISSAVVETCDEFARLKLVEVLQNQHVSAQWADSIPAESLRASLAGSDAGMTFAVAGFADCGAVISTSSSGKPRAILGLPKAHIAFLRESEIYPSMSEYAAKLGSMLVNPDFSALTIIGGPSKTADIEKTLVQGVHGPGVFAVVILADSMLSAP